MIKAWSEQSFRAKFGSAFPHSLINCLSLEASWIYIINAKFYENEIESQLIPFVNLIKNSRAKMVGTIMKELRVLYL